MDLFKLDLQLFAEGDQPAPPAPGDGDPTPPAGKTFTQEELDAIIAKRLAREQKQWETKLEEEKAKANMTEQERLKAELEEAKQAGQKAAEAANRRLISAELKVEAAAAGVPADRMDALAKLADLADAAVGDDGKVSGVKEAIASCLAANPFLLAGAQGGANLPGNPRGGAPSGTKSPDEMSVDEYAKWYKERNKK